MIVKLFLLSSNPFFESYIQSDILGKLIFIGLYLISICSWSILLYKIWTTYQAKKNAFRFYEAFQLHKMNPTTIDYERLNQKKTINPFLALYITLHKQCAELLTYEKNLHSQSVAHPKQGLTTQEIDYLASHLTTQIAHQVKNLEKNLYILATTVSLAPFLGLLGTVWGILTTFSALQTQGVSGTHQMVLSGLSLALATTVIGLLDAIPALVGYNYLKNNIRDFSIEMEGFANEILTTMELHYRRAVMTINNKIDESQQKAQ